MSIEELKADLVANQAQVDALGALSTTQDVIAFMKNTLWPFNENVVREMEEIDEAVQNLVDGADDILHEETAGLIAGALAGAVGLVNILKQRLKLPEDAKLTKAIREWEKVAAEAGNVIEEITVADPDDDDEYLDPADPADPADPDDEIDPSAEKK